VSAGTSRKNSHRKNRTKTVSIQHIYVKVPIRYLIESGSPPLLGGGGSVVVGMQLCMCEDDDGFTVKTKSYNRKYKYNDEL
jgi:hypothetical protein